MKSQPQFQKTENYNPKSDKEKRLMEAFVLLKNKDEVADFLRDLLTLAEIKEFANRLEMVRLLKKGYSYEKIAKEIGTSTTTVTRVAHWYYHGCGGYARIVDKLS